ncbi:MAG: DUF1289 domain-containing protein [Immundisolibacteraceae bacterium]|nr:DUF1289 domain-containing protein [Immundisolibacteraceae bacterium]
MNNPVSPCVAVCELNSAGQICIGCGRTSDEIALWRSTDEAGKNIILADAKQRLQAIASATD